MLDEYDQCALAKQYEFARSINSFVKNAARGSVTNLFVIVGSRPHGFHDKNVLEGDAKIEHGRDYKEIDLMLILRKQHKLFSDLVKDIANRRIRSVPWFAEKNMNSFTDLIKSIDPVDEAELYRRTSKAEQDLHFRVLNDYCASLPDSDRCFERISQCINDSTARTLHQKYLIIEACRRLQHLKKKNVEEMDKGVGKLIADLKSLAQFLASGAKREASSQLFYKVKDLREPALFLS